MRTYKPLSTISYNSEKFLVETLEYLIREDCISFWAICYHEAETDEKKAHYHVYIEPTVVLDTQADWFKDCFVEKSKDIEIPLGVMPWRKSRFEDWYLYSKHDLVYLRAKGLL